MSGSAGSPSLPLVVLTLARIEYNSLDLVLKVLGLNDGGLLPLVGAMLEVYAPGAFEQAMPGMSPAGMRMTVEHDWRAMLDDGQSKPTIPSSIPPSPEPNNQAFAKAKIWGALNGGLILPVILALAVLWATASAIEGERVAVSNERALLVKERSEALANLVQQNGQLSRALIDRNAPAATKTSSTLPRR